MRQPLRKIEAVDGGPMDGVAGGVRGTDHATSELGMICAVGRVVFLPEPKPEPRVVRDVARPGC